MGGSLVGGGDLETPYRDGHYLSGWTGEDGSEVAFPLEVDAPMTLTAKWEPNPPAGSGSGSGTGTGSGGTSTYTAATVAEYIENLSGPGPHTVTVTVTGSLSLNQVKDVIGPALVELGNRVSEARVSLDLSGVTGLTELMDDAFRKCTSLASVEIPEGVTTISDSAFEGCTSLTTVNYDGTPDQWSKINIRGNKGPLIDAYSNVP